MNMPPPAIPPPPKTPQFFDVKVTLPTGNASQALLVSACKKLAMAVPPGPISKRFPYGETVGYFKAVLEDGILDVGDRFFPKVPW